MHCKKMMTLIILVVLIFSGIAQALTAEDYKTLGRMYMFDRTLSGIRYANGIFEDGLNDQSCLDCSSDRELIFLHALSEIAMLVIRDDSNSIDSVLELAGQFGLTVLGDSIDVNELSFIWPKNVRDGYEIPDYAPDINDLRDIIDFSFIPQIDSIIAELDSIYDSNNDRFRMFLEPNEIWFATQVEVDYAEVLMLKGGLMAIKSHLQASQAYDLYLDQQETLYKKYIGGMINFKDDILEPHPDFLTIAPTANNPEDGQAILAQTKQDMIYTINYYLDAIDYMAKENSDGFDPQQDEIFYIDPNDRIGVDALNDQLTKIRDSLINDQSYFYEESCIRTYDLYDSNSNLIGQLEVDMGAANLEDGDEGQLIIFDSNYAPSYMQVEEAYISAGNIIKGPCSLGEGGEVSIDLVYEENGWYGGGYIQGLLSTDGNSVVEVNFYYWGPNFGTLENLSLVQTQKQLFTEEINLNPLFGPSAASSVPISPRDLLPELDTLDAPLPDTMASGLDYDPTLGGILPAWTMPDWNYELSCQPEGIFYLDEVLFGQVGMYGFVSVWMPDQQVLYDPQGDTDDEIKETNNIDIESLYLATLIGAYESKLVGYIGLHDYEPNSMDNVTYTIILSPSPYNKSAIGSIKLVFNLSYGSGTGTVYEMTDQYGYPYWDYRNSIEVRQGVNGVNFRAWIYYEMYFWGRYLSIETSGHDGSWAYTDGEKNDTHIRLAYTGSINGQVSYDAWQAGQPIYIQAYADKDDPDGSIVASTMITQPGPYTLEGIGLGFEGYVRAYTPLFGVENPFELGCFDVETSVSVFQWLQQLQGVDLNLTYPQKLQDGLMYTDQQLGDNKEQYYYIDAVQGTDYSIDVSGISSYGAQLELYATDASNDIMEINYWDTQHIDWLCPQSGRYFVKVNNGFDPCDIIFNIKMTTNEDCPSADIASDLGPGVKDCKVDMYDIEALAMSWLNSCGGLFWCNGADLDQSGTVDLKDFAIIADQWMFDNSLIP